MMIPTPPQAHEVQAGPGSPAKPNTHGLMNSSAESTARIHVIVTRPGAARLHTPAAIISTPSTMSREIVAPVRGVVQMLASAAYRPAATATQSCQRVHLFIELILLLVRWLPNRGSFPVCDLIDRPVNCRRCASAGSARAGVREPAPPRHSCDGEAGKSHLHPRKAPQSPGRAPVAGAGPSRRDGPQRRRVPEGWVPGCSPV